MIRKRILIISLLFSLSVLFSENRVVNIELDNFKKEVTPINNTFSLGIIDDYTKTSYTANFFIPLIIDKTNNKTLYMHVNNHRGYSRVFLNNTFLTDIGKTHNIKDIGDPYLEIIPLTEGVQKIGSINTIRIDSYSRQDGIDPIITIKDSKKFPFYITIDSRLSKTLPLSYSLVVVLCMIIYLYFKEPDEDKGNHNLVYALIIFIIYFNIIYIDDKTLVRDRLNPLLPVLSITGWFLLFLYHIKKIYVDNIQRITKTSFISLIVILSLSILYKFGTIKLPGNILYRVILTLINGIFLLIIVKSKNRTVTPIKYGLCISLGFHLISIFLNIFLQQPDYAMPQSAIISTLIGSTLAFFRTIFNKIEASKLYSNKLLETLEKSQLELGSNEIIISDLKNKNEDIIRDKSLFISTLGKTLRAPLNSIIGYSENLYTTENLSEVNPIVTEIIVEADKIFQAINNVMDFSSRDFTNNDLLLKEFRMKEIFDNSVYASPIISDFKNRINYKPIGVSDKVLIRGNPIIYRQIVSNVLHFLISLKPESIDYELFNTEITETHMNLASKFTAHNIKNSDQMPAPLNTGKDIFTKYIKLYNIYFKEELTDHNYEINLQFQCGLVGSQQGKKSIDETKSYTLDKNISVLIVDDYIPNLNIVKMHLLKMGCEVLTATNGEDAISLFNNEVVDVILMDINMPIMDGWVATEAIRSTEKGLDTLIIGLTASSLDLDIRHCFESGMDDVQVKPIRKKQLYNKLRVLDNFKPEKLPSLSSLRADYGISKVETETLFTSTINQISKQLEVLELLISAADDEGVKKEIPVLIYASSIINAFYFSRLIRNFENAYFKRESSRVKKLHKELLNIIKQVKEENETLFRN